MIFIYLFLTFIYVKNKKKNTNIIINTLQIQLKKLFFFQRILRILSRKCLKFFDL